MSIPSSSESEKSESADSLPRVPLAELPLVADQQQTVVNSNLENADSGSTEFDAAGEDYGDLAAALFSSDSSDILPGSVRLKHFEVRQRIGSGGMGRVFLGEDLTLRRPVALKVLNPSSAIEPAMLARFQNEARSAASLRHDNIAQVYFTGASHGIHFIACEYIAGRTIRDLIEEHETLSPDLVLNYAVQATLALNHMYASGVIHRDIKPSNIIVSNDGRVKIVDLGLARRDTPDSVCDVTVAGSTLGTFDYLAPEQARDPHEADVRSDIYSLGCTLYHMLTGQPPYPEGTALQKLLDHQGKQAPDPARINKRVPDDIADIVWTMMKTDPADRYQTPGELLWELIEVATEMGLQGIPADGLVWRQIDEPAARQHSGITVLLIAVVIFCITAATLHFSDSDLPIDALTTELPASGASFDTTKTEDSPFEAAAVSNQGAPGAQPAVLLQDSPGPFIIHSPNGKRTECITLSDALSSAQEGAEIELTFNGLSPVPIKQLPRLDHQTVRMFAADGTRPVLEFRGIRDDPLATSMFTLINSNLSLEGIAIRLVPDGDATGSAWSVFDCSGSTHLNLRQCSIAVADTDAAKVEICQLKESTSDKEARHNMEVSLTDVIVRGTADLFHIETQADGQIRLDNCGFGLEGYLLNNTGSASLDDPGSLELILEHVTCVLGAPLIRIFEKQFSAPRRVFSEVRVVSRASVFCSTVDGGTLIESSGTGLLDELSELLNWNGDTNLYLGYSDFWTLQIPNSNLPDLVGLDYKLDEWKSYWNTQRSQAQEINAFVFDWPDAAWKSEPLEPNESSNLNRLQRDWLRINGGRFHGGTQELPRYREREVLGAVVRRLPEFKKSLQPQSRVPVPPKTPVFD